MKNFIFSLALVFAVPAFAHDYGNMGSCPLGNAQFAQFPANVPGNTATTTCTFSSFGAYTTAALSDTMSFYLKDWAVNPQYYGFVGYWKYTSTGSVSVSGKAGNAPCSGRACGQGPAYALYVTGAWIDGVPLAPPLSGLTWTVGVDLAPGVHVATVNGTASGDLPYANWTLKVNDLVFTLVETGPVSGCCDNSIGDGR